ncbi:MAG: hypothetical protein GY862_36805 [Gammaproteobacteria bacterium]|nr:hypothetical protein [Gammaproteobacteria bacterium]
MSYNRTYELLGVQKKRLSRSIAEAPGASDALPNLPKANPAEEDGAHPANLFECVPPEALSTKQAE